MNQKPNTKLRELQRSRTPIFILYQNSKPPNTKNTKNPPTHKYLSARLTYKPPMNTNINLPNTWSLIPSSQQIQKKLLIINKHTNIYYFLYSFFLSCLLRIYFPLKPRPFFTNTKFFNSIFPQFHFHQHFKSKLPYKKPLTSQKKKNENLLHVHSKTKFIYHFPFHFRLPLLPPLSTSPSFSFSFFSSSFPAKKKYFPFLWFFPSPWKQKKEPKQQIQQKPQPMFNSKNKQHNRRQRKILFSTKNKLKEWRQNNYENKPNCARFLVATKKNILQRPKF